MSNTAALRAYNRWRRLRNKAFTHAVAPGFHSFGKRSVLALPMEVSRTGHISIGSRVYVGPYSWLSVVDPPRADVVLRIGDDVSIAGACVISAALQVDIAAGALLARGVYIADHDHAFSDTLRPVRFQGITEPRPVRIGEGSWLGQNVVVTAGVTVGRGAVVGAGSVITKDIPDYAVAVGAPARVLRTIQIGCDRPSP